MANAKTFTITQARINAATKLANVAGVDFTDKRNLPTTAKKAAKLETLVAKSEDGIFAGAAAAHMVAIGKGTFTSAELFTAMLKGQTKQDITDMDGTAARYDRTRFYRNASLAFIVSGKMPNAQEARRVDVKTGLVKEPKEKATPSRRVQGAGDLHKKSGGATPSDVLQANVNAACTTDDDGNVVDIKQFKSGDIRKVMQPDTMAAFIANIMNSHIICVQSHDADSKDVSFDDLMSDLNRGLGELLKG